MKTSLVLKKTNNLAWMLVAASIASVTPSAASFARPTQRIDYKDSSLAASDQHGNPIKLDPTQPTEIMTKALAHPLFKGVGEVIVNDHFETHRGNVVSVSPYIWVGTGHPHEFNAERIYRNITVCTAYDSVTEKCSNEHRIYPFAVGSTNSKSNPDADFTVYYDPTNADQSFQIDADTNKEILTTKIDGAVYEKQDGLQVLGHTKQGYVQWIPHCTGYVATSGSSENSMIMACVSPDPLEGGDSGSAVFQFGPDKKKIIKGLVEGSLDGAASNSGINIVRTKTFAPYIKKLQEFINACKSLTVITGQVIDTPKGCVPETPQSLKTAQQGLGELAAK